MKAIIFRIVAGIILVLEAIYIGVLAKIMIQGGRMDTEGAITITLVIGIPLLISAILIILSIKKVEMRYNVAKCFVILIGFVYIMILVSILFVSGRSRYHGGIPNSFIHNIRYSTNFIPFYTIGGYLVAWINDTVNRSTIIVNIIGNMLIFAPMGMLLPTLFTKLRNKKSFLLTILIMLIAVECIQVIFGLGSCDIDDIILNMIGAFIFYTIWKLKRCQWFWRRSYLIEQV